MAAEAKAGTGERAGTGGGGGAKGRACVEAARSVTCCPAVLAVTVTAAGIAGASREGAERGSARLGGRLRPLRARLASRGRARVRARARENSLQPVSHGAGSLTAERRRRAGAPIRWRPVGAGSRHAPRRWGERSTCEIGQDDMSVDVNRSILKQHCNSTGGGRGEVCRCCHLPQLLSVRPWCGSAASGKCRNGTHPALSTSSRKLGILRDLVWKNKISI